MIAYLYHHDSRCSVFVQVMRELDRQIARGRVFEIDQLPGRFHISREYRYTKRVS